MPGARTQPHADSRIAGSWTIRMHPSRSRRGTCVVCKESILPGMAKACRSSDVLSGGRWSHLACVPGGFRRDDTLVADDVDPIAEIQEALAEHAARGGTGQPVRHLGDRASSSGRQPREEPCGAEMQQAASQTGVVPMSQDADPSAGPAAPAIGPLDSSSGICPDIDTEDLLTSDLWMQAVQANVPVLREPPPHLREAFAVTKGALIRRAMEVMDIGKPEEVEQAWFQVLLFDKLVCHTGGAQHGSLNAKFRHRLRAADGGRLAGAPMGIAGQPHWRCTKTFQGC